MKKFRGFTLVEILVALMVLAVMGGMMGVGLRSAIRTYHHINIKSDRLSDIQSAIIVMERDIQQIINRPVIDKNGAKLPAVVLKSSGGNYELEFTHAGYINPFAELNRSTMQRVNYKLDKKKLIRETWQVLDRTPTSTSTSEELLADVDNFTIKLWYLTSQTNAHAPVILTQQVPAPAKPSSPIPLPAVVEFSLDTDMGLITRYLLIAGSA